MRATIVAVVAVFGMLAAPAAGQAAPAALHDLGMIGSEIVLVAGGCGPGWHPQRFVDRWGRWRMRCSPNRYNSSPYNYNRYRYNRHYYNRYY